MTDRLSRVQRDAFASPTPCAAPRPDRPPRDPALPARPGAGGVPDQRALVLASLVLYAYPREQNHAPRT